METSRNPDRAGPGRAIAIAAILVIALIAVLGFVRLFRLRFEAGDVYPAYSSLRADPLGTRALYEAVQSRPQLHVSRKHRALDAPDSDVPCTLLYLGIRPVDAVDVRRETAGTMNRFVRRGGRLVMTFLPRNWTRPKKKDEEGDDEEEEEAKDGDEK
ncbi:MAG: hypothetical protein HQ559_05740, partial [Lentisphaerae bacterium]|nr:hypothetical protein [Lentisphaerota bacterium]